MSGYLPYNGPFANAVTVHIYTYTCTYTYGPFANAVTVHVCRRK
jgi:hypothetical protein